MSAIPVHPRKILFIVYLTVMLVALVPVMSVSQVRGQARSLRCKDDGGAELYETYCASCHNPLEQSSRRGRSYSRIWSALKHQGVHGPIPHLSEEQVKSIACVLKDDETRLSTLHNHDDENGTTVPGNHNDGS